MQRKKGSKGMGKTGKKTTSDALCGVVVPGPQYQLKTLVGYKNHCISKLRNPAYTFGGPRPGFVPAPGPGPKYKLLKRRAEGFSFGLAAKYHAFTLGPGPKYQLPGALRGPYFSIKWKTEPRKIGDTPGPYYVKPTLDAPAYTMGSRTPGIRCVPTPGSYSASNLNVVKPRAPKYTMGLMQMTRYTTDSPGPKYVVKPPKPTPVYSFGIKHHKCAPPYITECDDKC